MSTRSIAGALTAAVCAALVPCALALAAPEGPPKPAPEMSNLKAFDGGWTCEGKSEASPMGPAGTMKGTVKSHTDLGGFWQSGMVKSTMAGMPGAMEGMFHMTYDPGAKQYVLLWVDNMGAYSQSTAAGWQGDKIVFNGNMSMGGKKMGTRDTFTKATDGSWLKHDWEGQIDGKWMPLGSETCKKATAAAND
jgi:Protein of unknown function (DUF1579)